ncbi:uncharacterized protein B0J16DRAFT_69289 [Fusarium flagelliforme]|uniref:uncharacterized protein n=1 Tax=Fusarium flagelliforme TaxID=2675880 RepID=UPI001E8D9AF8|nr:uncharacterized protein B0J16DRAFT_69289 [Fusarium flagelliforme]KAH7193016.1 hypothetical protein B0J16DRAFT_69289 [Fusarium flagelliforme]
MPQRENPNQSQTVLPPDAHQIASSNETLNTFLGGRTRSWMTGGSSAVTNPRPAPVAPSNSRKRNKKRKASDTAPPTQNDNDIERDNIPTDQSSEQLTGARETARASTVLPSPALTDVPSPNGSNQVDCTNLDSSVHAKSVGPGRPVSNSNMNQGDSIHVATNTHQPNPIAASSTQVRNSIPQHARIAEAATLATVANPAATGQARQTGDLPSRVNSTQHNSHESSMGSTIVHSRPSSTSEHRAKRPRVQEESGPDCQEWLDKIESRKAEFEQAGQLNEVESPRYSILSEACRDDDYFYIALHQTLCAWSLNKEPVHRLYRGLVEPTVIDVAFEIMQTILRKNESMSKFHLQWFANFPYGMAAFSRVFPRTNVSREISTFLVLMTTHWGMLLQNVQTRKYPLLVHELSHILRCRSRKLQSMLFTKSRRTICPDEGSVAKAINRIFQQDRHNERAYEARGEAPEVVKSAREAVAVNYRQLVLSQQQAPANTISSPVVGQTPSMVGQNAQQVVRPPLAASVSSSATNTTTPPLSLPHFDALAASVPTGGSGAASPTSVNEAYQHSSRGFQNVRRQNQLHIQTANPEARPLSAPVNRSPFEQQFLPRPSGAGSPLASQNRALPSNGQIRTPVLPSNNVLSQGRASSFTLPSQGLAEANASNSPVHVYSAGIPQVRSPAQMMYPHYAQAMQSPQYPPVYAQPNPPGHASALQSHNYAAQPTVPRTPTFQGAVTSNQIRQRLPVQQIPLSDYPRGPYGHDSLQVGLHQVEVRSPRRVPSHPGKGRFYQFVRSLVYEPTALEPQTGLRTLSFTVPERHIQGLSKKIEGNGLPFCYYSEGSYRYRLRICSQLETQAIPTESDWVVAATSWPSHIFIDLNMQHLELRRKQHFNKDQPVELTDHLHEGENVLKISFPAVDQNTIRGYKYFMAIEIVQTISHGAVLNLVQSLRHMSKDETEAKIQRRLRPSDSDDIIIEDETLTISLADPFSATRFAEPVRGSQCEHLECFDLETWFQTRPPKPPQNGGGPQQQGSEPSMVDVWKCPICSLDARPTSLWVDDYLAGVRRSLLSGGDMRTKSITVAADGKWAPVLDVDDSDDESTPVLQHRNVVNGNAGRQSRTSSIAAASTVIEILDDD